MSDTAPDRQNVDEFLLQHIDAVPQLEGLLLLWGSRPRFWSVAEMADALFINHDQALQVLDHLTEHGLAQSAEKGFAYSSSLGRDGLMQDVERSYRRDLIRISKMIHAKSSPLGQFARAFDLRKPKG